MRLLTLWIGKIIYVCLRLVGKRGAALPGLIVEKLYPKFLSLSLAKLPEGVVVITGTNGKTTTTKMLSYVLESEKRVLTNPTGSNFVRGVVASVIQHSDWNGRLPYDIAVVELDEAYAAKFVNLFSPRATVVLNVMRDQMDRFGEIDYTAKLVEEVVTKTTSFIVLNRDDFRVAAMSNSTNKQVLYFGVAGKLRKLFKNDDELHKSKAEKPKNDVSIDVELVNIAEDNRVKFKSSNGIYDLTLGAKGTYNAQNATAVFVAAKELGISIEKITTRLSNAKPAFGRGEYIKVDDKNVILQLVKNPGGFRHALLSGEQKKCGATIVAINDNYADSRDVSWLWDVSFNGSKGIFHPVVTSGTRAADMALRLKYDDISVDTIEPNLLKSLERALANIKEGDTLIIYTTYTAMLEIRKLLARFTEVEKV